MRFHPLAAVVATTALCLAPDDVSAFTPVRLGGTASTRPTVDPSSTSLSQFNLKNWFGNNRSDDDYSQNYDEYAAGGASREQQQQQQPSSAYGGAPRRPAPAPRKPSMPPRGVPNGGVGSARGAAPATRKVPFGGTG
eukprot:CAMPEP_0183293546 /NCGR_PEP_ID=MMETSP0160_2-20130417/2188_1 /TAXON_ID=2839 ORGANISM="Odontella Sinensis, Strain Grunow 1884" /NCGR_SAMPLE_ID=MMETSP0160_2 /ASSEMBLY_ACC=CAM_ASM_000250 /LENGTH=136 /DNA_ID=CAMNT_0025454677 /DNA_START=69 /DNA_END=476 /DNA_ORIENTATION=+